jgi:CheY-like chemotaxis protein
MSGGTVLIVEDDDDIRESLAEILAGEGFGVRTARHGREALARLAEPPGPCVVLLDLMMPVMNGWELAGRMRDDARLAAIPIVALSAAPNEPPDGVRLLRKPVELAVLLQVVREHCSQRG